MGRAAWHVPKVQRAQGLLQIEHVEAPRDGRRGAAQGVGQRAAETALDPVGPFIVRGDDQRGRVAVG